MGPQEPTDFFVKLRASELAGNTTSERVLELVSRFPTIFPWEKAAELLVKWGAVSVISEARPYMHEVARFLLLKITSDDFDDVLIMASPAIDVAWLAMIAFPSAYFNFCQVLGNKFIIDRDPLRANDGHNTTNQLQNTRHIYEQTFGVPAPEEIWSSSWHTRTLLSSVDLPSFVRVKVEPAATLLCNECRNGDQTEALPVQMGEEPEEGLAQQEELETHTEQKIDDEEQEVVVSNDRTIVDDATCIIGGEAEGNGGEQDGVESREMGDGCVLDTGNNIQQQGSVPGSETETNGAPHPTACYPNTALESILALSPSSRVNAAAKIVRCRCNVNDKNMDLLACTVCNMWEHQSCVKVSGSSADNQMMHVCPLCRGEPMRSNITCSVPKPVPGRTYYRQMVFDDTVYNLYDCVILSPAASVVDDGAFYTLGYSLIFRIVSMWMTDDGVCEFSGHQYLYPHQLYIRPDQRFYRMELILEVEPWDCLPFSDVIDKCAVMDRHSYQHGTVYGISKTYTYVCTQTYNRKRKRFGNVPSNMFPSYYKGAQKEISTETPTKSGGRKRKRKQDRSGSKRRKSSEKGDTVSKVDVDTPMGGCRGNDDSKEMESASDGDDDLLRFGERVKSELE